MSLPQALSLRRRSHPHAPPPLPTRSSQSSKPRTNVAPPAVQQHAPVPRHHHARQTTRNAQNSIGTLYLFLILMCVGTAITIYASLAQYPADSSAANAGFRTRLWEWAFGMQDGVVTKGYYQVVAWLKEKCGKHMMGCRPDGY